MRTHNAKSDRQAFDEALIQAVWQKGKAEAGYASETYRKDALGAWMERQINAHPSGDRKPEEPETGGR